jgi:shikimate dehydrogenase
MADAPKAFIIGQPIGHSRSPLIHGFWLKQFGLPGSYERIELAPEEVAPFLRDFGRRGFAGGNVTIPHKERVFELVERPTALARRLGAVNTLWLEGGVLHGDNTDVMGFVSHLDAALGADWPARTASALVLGAGGASRAIVIGLLDRGVGRVLIANRSAERAQSLEAFDPERVSAIAWDAMGEVMPRVQLVVNTTALGMVGQAALDLDLSGLPGEAAVADAVYVPLETPLLAAARRRGLKTVDGLGMLLHQAIPGFTRWFGRTPAVTPELRAHIVADLDAPHG